MLKNMKVGFRLMALVGMLATLLIGIGFSGLSGMYQCNTSLGSVYTDRVVPLEGIKIIADMYAVNIVDTAHKVRNGNITWAEARKNVDYAEKTIAEKWQAYLETYLVDEEKQLVAEIKPLFEVVNPKLAKLKNILKQEDAAAISEFTIKELYPAIDPVGSKFSALIDVQLVVAKKEYDAATSHYLSTRNLSIATIALGLLFGFALAVWIIRSVTSPLTQMQTVLTEIERTGDFSKQLSVTSNDECGLAAIAFNRMMSSLQAVLTDTNKVMGAVAQGDFSARVNAQANGDLNTLKASVNSTVNTLEITMKELNEVMEFTL